MSGLRLCFLAKGLVLGKGFVSSKMMGVTNDKENSTYLKYKIEIDEQLAIFLIIRFFE